MRFDLGYNYEEIKIVFTKYGENIMSMVLP